MCSDELAIEHPFAEYWLIAGDLGSLTLVGNGGKIYHKHGHRLYQRNSKSNLHLFYQQSVQVRVEQNEDLLRGEKIGVKFVSKRLRKFSLFTKVATSWMEQSRKLQSSQPLSQDSVNMPSLLSTNSVCRDSHHQDEIWIHIATDFMWWNEFYYRSRTHKGLTCLKTKTGPKKC